MVDRGVLIVLEGADGSAKSTQATLLAKRLQSGGHVVHATAEPTASDIGAMIRARLRGDIEADPHEMALLFAADRQRHSRSITAHLRQGTVVVCDRYELSNLVYRAAEEPACRCDCGWETWAVNGFVHHGGKRCRNLMDREITYPRARVVGWARNLTPSPQRPDLTIVLDVPAELALQRRQARGRAMDRYEGDEMQRRVCELYRRAAELLPGERVVVVDGTGSEGEVAERVLEAASEVLHD